MSFDLMLGGCALAFGVFTGVARFAAPNSKLFSKLEPMKEQWGDGPGTALHWVSYTVLPMVTGAVILFSTLA